MLADRRGAARGSRHVVVCGVHWMLRGVRAGRRMHADSGLGREGGCTGGWGFGDWVAENPKKVVVTFSLQQPQGLAVGPSPSLKAVMGCRRRLLPEVVCTFDGGYPGNGRTVSHRFPFPTVLFPLLPAVPSCPSGRAARAPR